MEKLTEKINSFKISKGIKEDIIKISEFEEIHIQQACRKLLKIAVCDYFKKNNICLNNVNINK